MTNTHVETSTGPIATPGSPLGAVRTGFEWIAGHRLPTTPRPVPASVSAAGPIRTWDELRERLWDPATPIAEIDATWVWLIERVRDRTESAMLASTALATPMLARATDEQAAPADPVRHDIESDVVTAFLAYLPGVGVDEPRLWHRLRWYVYRAALKSAIQQRTGVTVVGDIDGDLAALGQPVRGLGAGPGHPEIVLATAVAAGVISPAAAELIAASRCEGRSLTDLAAEHGVSLWKLRKMRPRAERALLAWLSDRTRDLDPDSTSPVEAHTVTTLAPRVPSPRRGRRPKHPSAASAPASTEPGQVAA